MARSEIAAIADRFATKFGHAPRLFRAPGRINIIGEHTDYSGGLVMPAAIDRDCIVAAARSGTRTLRLISSEFSGGGAANLDEPLVRRGGWIDYGMGVASVLMERGVELPGADLLIKSEVPVGAGLSSSAALEVAVAHALLALAGSAATGLQIARWTQQAENDFVGMPCGVMDQFASENGVAGSALLLDCATLQYEAVPLPEGAQFLLVDSMVRHTHVDGEYRSRREDCDAAAHVLGKPNLSALNESDLPRVLPKLSARMAKRCRHVVTENARVRKAADAMRVADLEGLGRLMNESHASLRDDMEVSIPEVDALASIAQQTSGVYGARMMGGGFGGSVIALADAPTAERALALVRRAYEARTGKHANGFICKIVAGAGEILP